jgi:hypothetical protein
MMNPERQRALELAHEAVRGELPQSADDILDRAEKYLAFLRADHPQPVKLAA